MLGAMILVVVGVVTVIMLGPAHNDQTQVIASGSSEYNHGHVEQVFIDEVAKLTRITWSKGDSTAELCWLSLTQPSQGTIAVTMVACESVKQIIAIEKQFSLEEKKP